MSDVSFVKKKLIKTRPLWRHKIANFEQDSNKKSWTEIWNWNESERKKTVSYWKDPLFNVRTNRYLSLRNPQCQKSARLLAQCSTRDRKLKNLHTLRILWNFHSGIFLYYRIHLSAAQTLCFMLFLCLILVPKVCSISHGVYVSTYSTMKVHIYFMIPVLFFSSSIPKLK